MSPSITSKPQIDLEKNGLAIGNQKLSLRAIGMGSHSHLQKTKKMMEDTQKIKEKYEPFIPNIRPWLVIIDVNMTGENKNTECTG